MQKASKIIYYRTVLMIVAESERLCKTTKFLQGAIHQWSMIHCYFNLIALNILAAFKINLKNLKQVGTIMNRSSSTIAQLNLWELPKLSVTKELINSEKTMICAILMILTWTSWISYITDLFHFRRFSTIIILKLNKKNSKMVNHHCNRIKTCRIPTVNL